MEKAQVDRINELARKKKTVGLCSRSFFFESVCSRSNSALLVIETRLVYNCGRGDERYGNERYYFGIKKQSRNVSG